MSNQKTRFTYLFIFLQEYSMINIGRENRICTQCRQITDGEYHILFDCTMHANERNISFEKIKTKTDINLFDASKQVENIKLLFKSDSRWVNILKLLSHTGKKPKHFLLRMGPRNKKLKILQEKFKSLNL